MCVNAEGRLGELAHLNEKTGPAFKIKDDPRILRTGRVIRKLSLDEVPRFWSVLKGDIPVVDPQPTLPKEVAIYNDYKNNSFLLN